MKANLYAAILLSGCAFAVSCSTTVTDAPAHGQTPIEFGTAVSRAAVDDASGLSSFSVWGGFDGQNNLFANTTVTPQGVYKGTRYWVANKTHSFYAVHPAGIASVADNGAITATQLNCTATGDAATDFMTASHTGILFSEGDTPQPVSLQFAHELCKVRFQVNTKEDVTLSGITLKGLVSKGDFSSHDAEQWKNLDTEHTFTSTVTQVSVPTDGGSGYVNLFGDLLLPPQSLNDNCIFTMTWTYNGNYESRTVNVPINYIPRYEKGNSYLYSATISESTTDITFRVEVGNWDDVEDIIVDLEKPETPQQ